MILIRSETKPLKDRFKSSEQITRTFLQLTRLESVSLHVSNRFKGRAGKFNLTTGTKEVDLLIFVRLILPNSPFSPSRLHCFCSFGISAWCLNLIARGKR